MDRGAVRTVGEGEVDVRELGLRWGGRREESCALAGADGEELWEVSEVGLGCVWMAREAYLLQ